MKKLDFTPSVPEIKKKCVRSTCTAPISTHVSSTQRDNKNSTGRLTDETKEINRNKIINIGKNVLHGDTDIEIS